ncbi:MAG: flagellar motor switch phosphatase FliY [Selenomonadaceae bacterium]
MSDDMISQEEIDALLNGGIPAATDTTDTAATTSDAVSPAGEKLSDMQKDALGEIGNISMGSAATTLSVLLGHKVSITTPSVSIDTMNMIRDHYPMPYLIVEVGYTKGIDGNNILAIQAQDASIIADLMMGGDGLNPPPELNEIHMSAVGESMNQMMGTVSTSLSTMFNKKIDISPPKVNLIDLSVENKVTELVKQDEPVVRISFRMEVDGLIDSEIMQILPLGTAKEMVESLLNGATNKKEEPAAKPAATVVPPSPAPAMSVAPPPMQQQPVQQQQQSMMAQPMQTSYGMQARVDSNVPVQPAQFMPLSAEPVAVNDANIGLILDVPLRVTVELGHTKKSIKDILELSNGSIVELDKLAGEPVDILVNGKLLAKGEVVVIDENFGVRITDIVSAMGRAQRLQ